jgi:hypothetical protein
MMFRTHRTFVLAAGLIVLIATPGFGQVPGPMAKAARRARQKMDRPQAGALQHGDPAPDFRLKTVDGKHEVRLAQFRGRQPVVLIFGSYT